MNPYLSMPCNGCSTQLARPEDLCEHTNPLCDTCCDQEHGAPDELLTRALSTWGVGRWAS